MDCVYVIGGKLGDVLSGIAIAQSQTASPAILTSQRYGSQIEIPGITLYLYEGEWDDLPGMIRYAKERFKKVLVPQTFGKEFPVKHTRPSFQLDQAARCGGDWEKARLRVERVRCATKQKSILLCDHSESSPFPHKESLAALIAERFPDHLIIRAAEMKLPKFTDFLKIYDEVSAIVTIDTAHLHLTAATNTPVFAFTWDKPVRWRGSAWHPRFRFYCRYSDYEARKEQFVHELQDALGGVSSPEIVPVETQFKHAYNPSIIEWDGRVIRAYRYNPDLALWPTRIAIDDQPVALPDKLKNCSVEDGRLFIFNGKLHISYNYTPFPISGQPVCAMAYGELVQEAGGWKLLNHFQPQYGKNALNGLEKNWLFYAHDDKLYAIYQCSPEQIIIQINGEKVMNEYRSHSPKFSMGAMRGGTQPIPYEGQWLRFFHTLVKTPENEVWWQYHIGALLMEAKPPFGITAVSKSPILSGDERYVHDWKFWKPRVAICYGAIPENGGWRVSVGINDSACADVIVQPEHLNL